MQRIALNEASFRPYIGRTVQARLKDGSMLRCTIKAYKNGRLYFSAINKGKGPTYNRLKKRHAKRAKTKAHISFFFFGAAIALALIAALFVVPFGFGGGCGGGYGGGFAGGFY
ncbi:hypothetical protein J4772_22060 [Cohnella sp. LGH]|uniref:hypothetical protein n=1 Tax=Cohnella sp. LGH TaxID=1619153 RepID=UPI001ADB3914|nr:hypothetical protein [Cohnella sp. LGH]QTH40272.1 hypothetical protein J4772_22060 [Cohnella sp. LGH]